MEPSGRPSLERQCAAAGACELSAAAGPGPLHGGSLRRRRRLRLLRAWCGVAAARGCCSSSCRDRPIPACPTGMGSTSVSWASLSPSSPPSSSERWFWNGAGINTTFCLIPIETILLENPFRIGSACPCRSMWFTPG